MNSMRPSHAHAEGKEYQQDAKNASKSYKPKHLFSEPDDVEDLGNQHSEVQGDQRTSRGNKQIQEDQQYRKNSDKNQAQDNWKESKYKGDRNANYSYQNYPWKNKGEGNRNKVNNGEDHPEEDQNDITEWHGKRYNNYGEYGQRGGYRNQDKKYKNDDAKDYSKYRGKNNGGEYQTTKQNAPKETYYRGQQNKDFYGYERDVPNARQKHTSFQGNEAHGYENQQKYQKHDRKDYQANDSNYRKDKQSKYEQHREKLSNDQYDQKPGNDQYAQKPGNDQYAQKQDRDQYAQKPGKDQYAQKPGKDQYAQKPGKDHSPNQEHRANWAHKKYESLTINMLVVDAHFKSLIAKLRKYGINTYSTSQLPLDFSQSRAALITYPRSQKLNEKIYCDVYELRENGDGTTQFLELISRYSLKLSKEQFMSRCINCNSTSFDLITPADIKAYEGLMAKAPSSHADLVWLCHSCKIPFYEGCRPSGF